MDRGLVKSAQASTYNFVVRRRSNDVPVERAQRPRRTDFLFSLTKAIPFCTPKRKMTTSKKFFAFLHFRFGNGGRTAFAESGVPGTVQLSRRGRNTRLRIPSPSARHFQPKRGAHSTFMSTLACDARTEIDGLHPMFMSRTRSLRMATEIAEALRAERRRGRILHSNLLTIYYRVVNDEDNSHYRYILERLNFNLKELTEAVGDAVGVSLD